ncbi:MAG: NifB/NifX family molybdenum-iron cluster-binding protein [Promethearchaeota archaeon]
MRIAIAEDSGYVSQHFGRTPKYLFVDIEGGKVLKKTLLENPGAIQHSPGQLPAFVSENNADWIIAGGMGPMAVQLFEENGISVVIGIQGSTDEVIQKVLNGTLEGGKSLCEHAQLSPSEHEVYHKSVHND